MKLDVTDNPVAIGFFGTMCIMVVSHDLDLADGVHKIRAKARDTSGNESDRTITVGVNAVWDYVPATPTPEPTSTPIPTSTPTLAI